MTRTPTENNHLPIYEDLVRERGDAVAEAQLAARHMQHQAAALLTRQEAAQLAYHRDYSTRAAAGGQPEQRGALR
ncbi:hypothetical protein [Streptomyces sp. NPDC058272]|uniref:hypothetical protein n=1 Tax=Streptomyces sp. NPDC058272 TaxID=3346415 RepID=UPI0036EAFE3E